MSRLWLDDSKVLILFIIFRRIQRGTCWCDLAWSSCKFIKDTKTNIFCHKFLRLNWRLYVRSHSWQWTAEHKPLHEVQFSIDLQDWIVSRLRSGESYRKMSASLKFPLSKVASIIRKWKTFGATRTVPWAGSQFHLRDCGRRALLRKVSSSRRTISAAPIRHVGRLKPQEKAHVSSRDSTSPLDEGQTILNT